MAFREADQELDRETSEEARQGPRSSILPGACGHTHSFGRGRPSFRHPYVLYVRHALRLSRPRPEPPASYLPVRVYTRMIPPG